MDCSRRTLLRALLGVVAGLVAGPVSAVRRSGSPPGPGWAAELLPDRAGVGVVAEAYLAAEPDAAARAARLRAELAPLPGLAARRAHAARRRAADFERGELVVLGGWVLAATEAELCLIVHGAAT